MKQFIEVIFDVVILVFLVGLVMSGLCAEEVVDLLFVELFLFHSVLFYFEVFFLYEFVLVGVDEQFDSCVEGFEDFLYGGYVGLFDVDSQFVDAASSMI